MRFLCLSMLALLALETIPCVQARDAAPDDIVVSSLNGGQGLVRVRDGDTLLDLDNPLTQNDFVNPRTVSVDGSFSVVIAGDLGYVWFRSANDLHHDLTETHGTGYGPVIDSCILPNGNIVVASAENVFLRDRSLEYIGQASGFANQITSIAPQSDNDIVVNWPYNNGNPGYVIVYGDDDNSGGMLDNEAQHDGFYDVRALVVQSNDYIVTANTAGNVFFRGEIALDYVGQINLGKEVTRLARLSNDVVIAGCADGSLYALAADGSSILGSDAGYGTISAMGVQSDDDVIVGNLEGELRRISIDQNAGTFAVAAFWDGFGEITDLAILPGSGPGPTLAGDLNGDGSVGSGDLDIVRANWGSTVTPGDLSMGDANGDGGVGSGDLDIVRANWGQTLPVSVPEPSAIAFLLIAAVCGLVRRHR